MRRNRSPGQILDRNLGGFSMRTKALAIAATMVVLVFGVNGAFAQEDIQELAEQWASAYNKHDKDALGSLYTEDAALMMHGGPTYNGREDIADFWETDFEIGSPLTLLRVTHSVVGVDMMLVHGDYQVIDREDGAQLGGGRFAHIWIKGSNDRWQLDRDLWSEPFEPYE